MADDSGITWGLNQSNSLQTRQAELLKAQKDKTEAETRKIWYGYAKGGPVCNCASEPSDFEKYRALTYDRAEAGGYAKGGPVTYKNSHPHADAYGKSMDASILAKGRFGR